MNIDNAQEPDTLLSDSLKPASAVVDKLKRLSLRERLAIIVTALSAGVMTGVIFIVTADGLVWTIGESLRLPLSVEIGLLAPVTLVGLWIIGWMFLRTYRYETKEAKNEADDTPSQGQ